MCQFGGLLKIKCRFVETVPVRLLASIFQVRVKENFCKLPAVQEGLVVNYPALKDGGL